MGMVLIRAAIDRVTASRVAAMSKLGIPACTSNSCVTEASSATNMSTMV
jgi:hypothetical protein